MQVGDRFVKDGQTFECTSVSDLGIGYRKVKEEVFEITPEPEPVFEAPEPEPEPVVKQEPVKRGRRTKK